MPLALCRFGQTGISSGCLSWVCPSTGTFDSVRIYSTSLKVDVKETVSALIYPCTWQFWWDVKEYPFYSKDVKAFLVWPKGGVYAFVIINLNKYFPKTNEGWCVDG